MSQNISAIYQCHVSFSTYVRSFLSKSIPYFTLADDALSVKIAISTELSMSIIISFWDKLKKCEIVQ